VVLSLAFIDSDDLTYDDDNGAHSTMIHCCHEHHMA